jgi:hypothetical protein
MKTTRLLLLFSNLILLLNAGCSYAIRYDGTYTGIVVDVDTRDPIEGAVVLGTWYTVAHTVAGGVSSYYDARETVTDKNGEFSIPGMGLRIMSNLEPMDFLIFKAGYEHVGSMPWVSLKVDILLSKKIEWKGSEPLIPLRKLTMEERKKQSGPSAPPSEAPLKNVILMLREIDKNDKERGLPTRGIWKGEKYE